MERNRSSGLNTETFAPIPEVLWHAPRVLLPRAAAVFTAELAAVVSTESNCRSVRSVVRTGVGTSKVWLQRMQRSSVGM